MNMKRKNYESLIEKIIELYEAFHGEIETKYFIIDALRGRKSEFLPTSLKNLDPQFLSKTFRKVIIKKIKEEPEKYSELQYYLDSFKMPKSRKKRNLKLKRVAMVGLVVTISITNKMAGSTGRNLLDGKAKTSTATGSKIELFQEKDFFEGYGVEQVKLQREAEEQEKKKQQEILKKKNKKAKQEQKEKQQKQEEKVEKEKEEKEEKQEKNIKEVKKEDKGATLKISKEQGEQYQTRMTSFWKNDGHGNNSITGCGLGIDDFQANEKGWYTYKNKLVVATATKYLLKEGFSLAKGVRTYRYYDEITLTIDGKNYPAIVLDSCGNSMKTGRIDLFVTDRKHAKDTRVTVTENKGKEKVKSK